VAGDVSSGCRVLGSARKPPNQYNVVVCTDKQDCISNGCQRRTSAVAQLLHKRERRSVNSRSVNTPRPSNTLNPPIAQPALTVGAARRIGSEGEGEEGEGRPAVSLAALIASSTRSGLPGRVTEKITSHTFGGGERSESSPAYPCRTVTSRP
jgi:hypothetical protein